MIPAVKTLLSRWRGLPAIDPAKLRAEVDEVLDSEEQATLGRLRAAHQLTHLGDGRSMSLGGRPLTRQLTIRYDDRLAREIEDLARREGISRNQAVLRLLRRGVEPAGAAGTVGEALDWFIGAWSQDRARELEEAIADFETVDEDLWE